MEANARAAAHDHLLSVSEKIGALEEHHNEILDALEHTHKEIKRVREETLTRADRLTERYNAFGTEIRTRLASLRKASLLLSLVAQKEEVTPIRARIDNQPYEAYLTPKEFLKLCKTREK